MKRVPLTALIALSAIMAFASSARATERCVAYGDPDTDYTWRLCPGGEKYERRYFYFGIWSRFYRVESGAGECHWAPARSSWVCAGRTIQCDAKRCGLR
jgi:hypothetical protein